MASAASAAGCGTGGGAVAAVRPTTSHYIDDTFVSTLDTFKEHLAAVRAVFKRLEAVGFGARVDKVEFARPSLTMLGWRVEEGRITTDREKVHKMISEIGGTSHRLRDRKDVMSALGSLNFYRSMIPNAGSISAPLYQLTKKGAFEREEDWTPMHSAALRALKTALISDNFLAAPQENKEFYLVTDASVHSGAAVLAQVQPNGAEHPVWYAGISFTDTMRRWSPSERECYTLLWGAEYFEQWLKFGRCVFCTDHSPLVALAKAGRSQNSKLARWSAKLSQWYQAEVSYRAGITMGLSDTLSRLIYPAKEETPDTHDSLIADRGPFEPLENTDHGPNKGHRLYGLPMQRLSMLRPPSGAAWVSAQEAYARATADERQQQPPLHESDALSKAQKEDKGSFHKRHDWFQRGVVTPDMAVRIMQHAEQIGLIAGITAEQLGDGATFVTQWTDTRGLEELSGVGAALSDDGAGVSIADGGGRRHELPARIVLWREFSRTTVAEIVKGATGIEPDVDEKEYLCCHRDIGLDMAMETTSGVAGEADEHSHALDLQFLDCDANPYEPLQLLDYDGNPCAMGGWPPCNTPGPEPKLQGGAVSEGQPDSESRVCPIPEREPKLQGGLHQHCWDRQNWRMCQ